MKSAEQIKLAIETLENDLKAIRIKIRETEVYINSGRELDNKEFFCKQVEYLEDLRKQEWYADYRLRAYRWVLDTDDTLY